VTANRPVPKASSGHDHPKGGDLDRRTVMAGAGALVLTATLQACTGQDAGSPPVSGTTLGSSSDVPVGGGTVFADAGVVVTQPTRGEFHAFSAICTHQGCSVTEVKERAIICSCHGSQFDLTDGSVVLGPALEPLPRADVTVEGTSMTLG
jgi:nitrite reductase/ring-hydroxylating ferredoxin subunit